MKTFRETNSSGPGNGPHVSSSFQHPIEVWNDEWTRGVAEKGKSPILLRRMKRHWWPILLLTVFVSAPLLLLIYYFVQPAYEAIGALRIERDSPPLDDYYSILKGKSSDGLRSDDVERTHANLITSTRVLRAAVTDPSIAGLPMIKKSSDPVNDIRRNLMVNIDANTQLDRRQLEIRRPERGCRDR
jgi:uncharacterized protein involved in exopolysaccharide biosynthesis